MSFFTFLKMLIGEGPQRQHPGIYHAPFQHEGFDIEILTFVYWHGLIGDLPNSLLRPYVYRFLYYFSHIQTAPDNHRKYTALFD